MQHIFPAQIYGWGENEPHVSQRWGTELNQILGGHRTVIGAPLFRFKFQTNCFLSELDNLKSKFGPNFALFDPPPLLK